MHKILGFLLCFFITVFDSWGQQNYKEHKIEKGETVYRISRKYGVSVRDIFNLNPGSKDVIYAGRFLKIPVSPNQSGKAVTYTVVRGDTKIGLSRRFGVSVLSLVQQNPHIKKMLQAGHVLNIDPDYKSTKPDLVEGERFVTKGETLWGIAREYNISLDALLLANKDRLDGVLKVGQILRIPDIHKNFNKAGYYLVKKGDTKWGLARKFKTTVAALERENPQIVDLLLAGERIKIGNLNPSKSNTASKVTAVSSETKNVQEAEQNKQDDKNTAAETTPKDVNQTLVETNVQESENESSELEKINNESEDTEKSNKEDTATSNTITSTVSEQDKPLEIQDSIPKTPKESEVQVEKTDIDEKLENEKDKEISKASANVVDYVVEMNETAESLANKANMSISEFLELNPELKNNIQPGMVIKMPKSMATDNSSDKQIDKSKRVGLISGIDKTKKAALYFYLPFSKEDFASKKIENNFEDKSESDGKSTVDFYEGATLAIDKARKMGIDVDFEILNSEMNKPLNTANETNETSILVPFTKEFDLTKINASNRVNVISVLNDSLVGENQSVFNALPSKYLLKAELLNFLKEQDANVLVITNKDKISDSELLDEYLPEAKVLKVDNTGFIQKDRLKEALSKNQRNYVILETELTIVYLGITTTLMENAPFYDLRLALLDESNIPESGRVSHVRFKILKTIYPSLFPAPKDIENNEFSNNYNIRFSKEPSKSARIGFDTTLDVILRMVQENMSLEESISNIESSRAHLNFDYKKINDLNYQNTKTFILQFDTEKNIMLIDR
ncbi:MAG: LysM peptidoglycan-binding domain-containing protein [Bacteroidota bacterium]